MKVLSKLMVVQLFFSQMVFASEVVAEKLTCEIKLVSRCACDASMIIGCESISGASLLGHVANTQDKVSWAEFAVELKNGNSAFIEVNQLEQGIRNYYGGSEILKEDSFLKQLKISKIKIENIEGVSLEKFQILSTDLNLYADSDMSFAHYEKGNQKLSESSPIYYSAFTDEVKYVEGKNCNKKVMLDTITVYSLQSSGLVKSVTTPIFCQEGTANSELCFLDPTVVLDESTGIYSCI